MALRIELKPQERLIINGALIRNGDRRSTFVIDKKGRVAARFLGAIDGPSSLRTIIDDTLAESD